MPLTTRRHLLATGLVGTAALALPRRVFAQASAASPRDRRVLEIAQAEIARAGEVLWRRDIAAIADFGVHSAERRFHFADMENGTVRSFHVTHGRGSDPEHDGWLNGYSNIEGSLMTSRGAYISWEWYKGRYGTSIRMGGLDPSNSNALPRAIVMHPAQYATQAHLAQWGRLGRSDGCFAMAPEDFREALWHLSGGRLLFADTLGLSADGTRLPPSMPPGDAPLPGTGL